MRSPKKRKEIKDLARKARAGDEEPSRAVPGPPPPVAREVLGIEVLSCSCGALLKIPIVRGETRHACSGCKRGFTIEISNNDAGQLVLDAMFHDDPSAQASTRFVVAMKPAVDGIAGAGTEGSATETALEVLMNRKPLEKGLLDDAIEPTPPAKLAFLCPCGMKHQANRSNYDKRVTCKGCGTTLLVNVLYEAATRSFRILPIRILK